MPRWNVPRTSPLARPYSSLPRGQDPIDYPFLMAYRASIMKPINHQPQPPPSSPRAHSPARRSHSEDVYAEKSEKLPLTAITNETTTNDSAVKKDFPVPRVNPLTKAAAEGKLQPNAVAFEMFISKPASLDSALKESSVGKKPRSSPRRKLQQTKSDTVDATCNSFGK